MKNIERRNQIAMFAGGPHHEPCIVLAGGINGFGSQVLRILNTGCIIFTAPEEETLLDFDFKKFQLIEAEWKLNKAKELVGTRQKELNDLKGVPNESD